MTIQDTQPTMIHLTINGVAINVPKGTTVYTAAKQLGIDIPIFCYQDRMPPFGACRMCLVEVEKMPKLQASCTLEATEGMVVNTQSSKAVKEREGIIEFLLLNHPLDCPICDRGGECPLQDQALEHGPGESRFFEEKRHFKKPYPLGPVLMLDRERCIVCARCTRFGDIIAGDHALEFIERGYRTEVGTPGGGPAESKFIGNTISICPVGALTSRVYRFRARPWDNTPIESTCSLCPVGCSLILDSRDGEIMRTRARENREINDIWLCDKGWFGYEFSENPERLQTPLIRRGSVLMPATWEEALSLIATKIKEAKPNGKLAAWGGNPLTIEENYLFQKLMREGAAINNLDHRIGVPLFSLEEEGLPPGMQGTIQECEELSYAILFGLDLTEEFPIIWLRLKQAINKGAQVIFLGHFSPEISPHLSRTIIHPPGDELEILRQHMPHFTSLAEKGKKGALFVGSQYLANSNRKKILTEIQALQKASSTVTLNILEGRGNSMGARLGGMRPDLKPLGLPINQSGLNSLEVIKEAASSGWDFLYVAGANPATKFPTRQWQEARDRLKFLVVQDLFLTSTAEQADVVLPTLSFLEKEGSFINIEGRIQKLQPGKKIPEGIYSDASIFIRIAEKLGFALSIDTPFKEMLANKRISLKPQTNLVSSKQPPPASKNGDSLYASFAYALFDHGVRMQHDPHLVQLAKDPRVRLHPLEAIKRSLKNEDEVRVVANGTEIQAKVKVDGNVSLNTAVLPLGFESVPVHEFGTSLLNGMPIELKRFDKV